jgi:hypothetical protein
MRSDQGEKKQVTVSFREVGRDKKTWTADMDSLSDSALIKQIKKQRALASSGIDFAWDDCGQHAGIYAGGFRHVGNLSVEGGVKFPGKK